MKFEGRPRDLHALDDDEKVMAVKLAANEIHSLESSMTKPYFQETTDLLRRAIRKAVAGGADGANVEIMVDVPTVITCSIEQARSILSDFEKVLASKSP